MEGGLLRAVTEIPTRVRLCSQMNSCAGQPPAPAQTQIGGLGGSLSPLPPTPASVTCPVPDSLRGENKTNRNLTLPGAVLPLKPP